MKIKLDENLPAEPGELLTDEEHVVDTAHDEGLDGQSDADVWEAAQVGERFLITQDLDFSDARRYRPGTHQGILLVRLREPTRRKLIDRITDAFRTNDASQWQGCLVVMSDSRLRIHRPPER